MLFITDRSIAVVIYSNCHCSSTSCLFLTFCPFCLGKPGGHLLRKSWPRAFALFSCGL